MDGLKDGWLDGWINGWIRRTARSVDFASRENKTPLLLRLIANLYRKGNNSRHNRRDFLQRDSFEKKNVFVFMIYN